MASPGCPHVWVPTCLGAHMSGCPHVWVPTCLGAHMSGCPQVWVPTCLDAHMSGCPHVWVSTCLDAHKSGCPHVWVPTCLAAHMSGCPVKFRPGSCCCIVRQSVRTNAGKMFRLSSVAYRGGGCSISPPPRNSEVLTKLSRIPSSVENTSLTV
jgi:hypothetical protein